LFLYFLNECLILCASLLSCFIFLKKDSWSWIPKIIGLVLFHSNFQTLYVVLEFCKWICFLFLSCLVIFWIWWKMPTCAGTWQPPSGSSPISYLFPFRHVVYIWFSNQIFSSSNNLRNNSCFRVFKIMFYRYIALSFHMKKFIVILLRMFAALKKTVDRQGWVQEICYNNPICYQKCFSFC